MQEKHKHFFISYTNTDQTWAKWIAWQLEQEGYSVLIQAWDFRPGNNFFHEMDEALRQTERIIAVLSHDYLNSTYAKSEWMAVFQRDPLGKQRILLPIRIADCEVQGLLGMIIPIDLFGIDERTARKELLAGIRRERITPQSVPFLPTFPPIAKRPTFPGKIHIENQRPVQGQVIGDHATVYQYITVPRVAFQRLSPHITRSNQAREHKELYKWY